jgi:glycosyltransferase involved in cell wall biosynthesis
VRYLFLAPIYRKEDEALHLSLSKGVMAPSSNTFPWEIINGLERYEDNVVDIINVLPVGTFPRLYKKLMLKTENWSHNGNSRNVEIGSVNLLFLKQFIRTVKIKKEIRKWISESKDNNTIIVYFLYLPFLTAIKDLPDDVKIIAIVPDLPEYTDLTGKRPGIMALLRKINNNKIYKSLKRINGYVLVTEQMKEALEIGEKPYAVVEGIAPEIVSSNDFAADDGYKTILYTGTLNYRYGIMNLLNAFSEIKDGSYRLWICGVGEAADDIVKTSKADKRIVFYGHVSKEKVYELLRKATILINPRTDEGEYTKYSFPSKTMDYMVSGKPVMMYKLDGIPAEYDEHIYYVEGNTVEALKDKIIEVCSKLDDELQGFGARAREWVLLEKNSAKQVKKIIKLVQKIDKQVVLG